MMQSNRLTLDYAEPEDVLPCLKQISGSENWRSVRLLGNNGSQSTYKIKTWAGACYHLRLGQASSTEHIQTEGYLIDGVYQVLDQQNLMITPALKLVACGRCHQDCRSYLLTHWVDGHPGSQHIRHLDQAQEYRLGISAGLTLSAVHCLAGPVDTMPWVEQIAKRCRQLESGLPPVMKQQKAVAAALSFLDNNRSVVRNRPVRVLYNNLSWDHMVMYQDVATILVNFSQWRYGDPLYDLAPVLTDLSRTSIPFASGLLDCYLSQRVNTRTMRPIVYYAVLRALERLQRVHERKMPDATAVRNIERLAENTDGFGQIVPRWYPLRRRWQHDTDTLWTGG